MKPNEGLKLVAVAEDFSVVQHSIMFVLYACICFFQM